VVSLGLAGGSTNKQTLSVTGWPVTPTDDQLILQDKVPPTVYFCTDSLIVEIHWSGLPAQSRNALGHLRGHFDNHSDCHTKANQAECSYAPPSHGEMLVGCIERNRWGHPGDDQLIMELMENDLEALRGLTGSG